MKPAISSFQASEEATMRIPPNIRPIFLIAFIIFALLGSWQYFGYRDNKEANLHFWVSVALFVVAMVSFLIFLLSKPDEDPSDISITKF